MSCNASIPEGGIVSPRQSLRQKEKNVFHLQVPKKRELLKSCGLVRNLILQSRLWSGNIGRSYLFLALPYTPSPSVITRRIPLRTGVLFPNECDQLQQSPFLLSLCLPLVFQSALFFSAPSLFHPLTPPNQSSAIRQLRKLYREVFAMCVCGVRVERSPRGLCMCAQVEGGFSQSSSPLG